MFIGPSDLVARWVVVFASSLFAEHTYIPSTSTLTEILHSAAERLDSDLRYNEYVMHIFAIARTLSRRCRSLESQSPYLSIWTVG